MRQSGAALQSAYGVHRLMTLRTPWGHSGGSGVLRFAQ